MEIVVADDQLSLAIGKRGQNVRLAAKLISGWKIDIKSESRAAEAELLQFSSFDGSKEEESTEEDSPLPRSCRLMAVPWRRRLKSNNARETNPRGFASVAEKPRTKTGYSGLSWLLYWTLVPDLQS